MKRTIIKGLILLIVVFGGGIAVWIWGCLHFTYSEGERAGYIQKFSKKGWLIKTYEGELAMVNLPGAMPEMFLFTVRDEKVVEQIQQAMGNRVVLEYGEHKFLPGKLFGETPYFVSRARPVNDAEAPAPLPVAQETPIPHP